VSKRSRIITIIIIASLTVYAIVSLYLIWELTAPLNREQQEDRERVAELQQKIANLEYMLENTDDPVVIRRIAEELLGLVSPDEIVIIGDVIIIDPDDYYNDGD
jgi:cell division protein FtsB